MSTLPTQLSKSCEVCGGRIYLVNPFDETKHVAHYTCPTCKAVYYPTGKRNMTYPCIYDQGTDTAGVPPVMDDAATRDLRLKALGLKHLDVVLVRDNSNSDWEYGNVLAASRRTIEVRVPGRTPKWYSAMNWKDGKAPMPIQVSAPASAAHINKLAPAYLANALRRPELKAQEPVLTVWTTTGDGSIVSTQVKMSLLKPVRAVLSPVMTVPCYKMKNPYRDVWHAFHRSIGVQLGVAESPSLLASQVRRSLNGQTKRKLDRALADALARKSLATPVTMQEFFKAEFA